MNVIRVLIGLLPVLGFAVAAATQGNTGLVNPGYHEQPAWFKASFLDIREDLADAAVVNARSEEQIQTPEGQEIPVKDWAKELGIEYTPSLVLFDAEGKEVFRTEGYLRSFHIHGALDYVTTGAYLRQTSFQRYLQEKSAALEVRGLEIDLMD